MTATPPGGEPAAAPGERGPGLRGPRVGVVAEQLLRPVPGGVGRYVRALAAHLPVEAAVDRGAVEFLVARHPAEQLAAAGLPPAQTRRLAWPGRLVTRTWVTLRRPGLPSGLLDDLDVVLRERGGQGVAQQLALVRGDHRDADFHAATRS